MKAAKATTWGFRRRTLTGTCWPVRQKHETGPCDRSTRMAGNPLGGMGGR
jgi:hypothetical protein